MRSVFTITSTYFNTTIKPRQEKNEPQVVFSIDLGKFSDIMGVMGFGKRLKEARVRKGYTQKELADLVGSTGPAISDYELDKRVPRVGLVKELAIALDIRTDYLFETFIKETLESDAGNEIFDILNKTFEMTRPEYLELLKDKAIKAASEIREVYEAGPVPEGLDPEIWVEVPPRVGPAVAEKLMKRFAINIPEGELCEERIQAVLKYLYYLWLIAVVEPEVKKYEVEGTVESEGDSVDGNEGTE